MRPKSPSGDRDAAELLAALNYDGDGMADRWRSILANEPFNVSHDAIGRLTNKQVWEWHLKLGLERAKKLKELAEGTGKGSGDGSVFSPATPDEIQQAMGMLKAMLG